MLSVYKKKFCALPLDSLPSPSFFCLDRVQYFSVQMQHLDSNLFQWNLYELLVYLWRFMVIDGHSFSWYFSVFTALSYFLRDLPGMLQRRLTLDVILNLKKAQSLFCNHPAHS